MQDKEIRLNLGCGNKKMEGFINIDLNPNVKPDIIGSVLNLSEFEDNSVDEIVAECVLDHIERKDCLVALKEWYRVLKPKGKLLIRCSDANVMYRFFNKTLVIKEEHLVTHILGQLGKDNLPIELERHRNMFWEERLVGILSFIGFRGLHRLKDNTLNLIISGEK